MPHRKPGRRRPVLLILAPIGQVWHTAQVIGWACALLATIAALTRDDEWGELLIGLALAGAATSRTGMLFNGVWIAFSRCRRGRTRSPRRCPLAALCGLAPIAAALLAQGASCALPHIPMGLGMGTGYITFGPRSLLDLLVPLAA